MKASSVKAFLSIHTWTGIGTGMVLFIAFYAGALTVFLHELETWDDYQSDKVVVQHTLADSQRLLDLAVANTPGMDDNLRLYPADTEHPTTSVIWYQRLEDRSFKRHDFNLDQNGGLSTAEHQHGELAQFIYRLHYTAGLPRSFGIYVLGIVSLIYGLALISGLLIFLPNLMRDLFSLRSGKNKKRFWLDSHNAVGVISLPWHLMFAWSSVLLCIGIFLIGPFQILVYEEDLVELIGPELGVVQPLKATGEAGKVMSLASIISISEREAEGFSPTQLRFSNFGDSNTMVQVFGKSNTETLLTNVSITMNAVTGDVLSVAHPDNAGLGATFYNGLLALHYVSFGGFFIKWIYFLLGLAGAFLFYSGNVLWIETRRKKRTPNQPTNTILLARLNSGVCLGCMAGISAAFLMSRGMVGMESRGEFTEWAYYLTFFTSICWMFVRPVAAGTRDLLFSCALFTGLIPIFDASFAQAPIWQSFIHGNWPMFSVNLVALFGAYAFWKLALAVKQRASNGDTNSVWSL